MKFFFKKIIFFFLFISVSEANNNLKFIDINFIVNNSISGKNLNEIIEKKNKKVVSELNKIRDKLKIKKDKIVAQKNILKKDEYENEVKDFNEIKKKKTDEFNNFSINSKKKIIDLLNPLITNYLKKESIQILLQKDKIIFGDDKLNITQDILKLFDDKYKKIKFE
ncbi:OmpH family outer membrane protein [Candidatus Pelagibacter sp.]|nr:OmpH family outer membrane protein [Candidatus Pelagibacter sp.]